MNYHDAPRHLPTPSVSDPSPPSSSSQEAPTDATFTASEGPAQSESEQEEPIRSDPWKSFRGVCSGILILEMIAILLALPVVMNVSSFRGASWIPALCVIMYAVALFFACAIQKKPWALSANIALQLVLLAGGFLHSALAIMGAIFLVVWLIVWRMQRAVRRVQGSRTVS